MDAAYYLKIFQQAVDKLDKQLLAKKQMNVAIGTVLESVFLKLYKPAWANKTPDPLTSPSRIFFSVWVNDKTIKEGKLFYNIHALKLRQLKGYTLTSREFASVFREKFKPYEKQWPNASTDFGPLTLMEGWVELNAESIEDDIFRLGKQFLKIDYLIDGLLEKYK